MGTFVLFAFVCTVHSALGLALHEKNSAAFESSTIATSPAPTIITKECGGTLEVGRGEAIIEYLPQGGYQNWESCIWMLLPTAPYNGYSIDYEPRGMERHDGVMVYTWDEDANLTKTKIRPSDVSATVSISQPLAAIVFSSDSSERNWGFRLKVTGTGNSAASNYRSFWVNQTVGTFSYPDDFGLQNYQPKEIVALAVQVPMTENTKVAVDFTDIEDDPLTLYELDPYSIDGTARLIGTTNGSNPKGVPELQTYLYYPRLFLFHSNDNSKTGKGFSISWRR